MSAKLDMTAMYGAHDALRRELELPARTAAGVDDDPRRTLGAAVGWELFKKSLHVHLTKPLARYAQTALMRRYGRPNDPDDHELLRTLVLDGLLR